jgi:hypothetical protein
LSGQNDEGISTNLRGAIHEPELAADQGIADPQFNYGICLEKGEGVGTDLQKQHIVSNSSSDDFVIKLQCDRFITNSE